MPETELLSALANLGAAGLIGWMWLTERRAAAVRDAQISAAHDRIRADEQRLGVLLSALDSNTRALTTLEAGHARLIHAIERLTPFQPQTPHHAGHQPQPSLSLSAPAA
ncbi:MAG: hypothetical protein H7Y88_08325 [Phycisphaerales bacterium]|nr:hypothetical protein [Phycisphaerales bacterium]